MTEERTCRVQVLVDGYEVADCECLSCDVEIERGGQGERRTGRAPRPCARVVSDDERRDVARGLREIRPCKSGHIKWWEIARALGLKQPAGWFGWEKFEPDSVNRLADLIEPDEPPYNLYTLYEAVFHRSPRCWECIEDDEVDELVNALLDICNAPGHEHIQRSEPSEPKVRCVAEVKVDGEQLERPVHDAAVELTGIDRDALLSLADEMDKEAERKELSCFDRSAATVGARYVREISRRIREALGVEK